MKGQSDDNDDNERTIKPQQFEDSLKTIMMKGQFDNDDDDDDEKTIQQRLRLAMIGQCDDNNDDRKI